MELKKVIRKTINRLKMKLFLSVIKHHATAKTQRLGGGVEL
jgi:hypothetical protein